MLTSRERVKLALNHREPDRVPLDLGGTLASGMHVTSVYRLRQQLGLDPPGTPVKVIEPFQMLGEIGPDLMDALGVDVAVLMGPKTFFGFKAEGWKPWTFFDGTPVLVPAGFNTDAEPNGDILMYPEGDKSVPPSGRMPRAGFYFDAIIRQPPIDDARLDPRDNAQDFGLLSDEDLAYFRRGADELYTRTDKAIVGSWGGTSFGDIALVPGMGVTHPKGIRDVEEWYVSTVTRRDYVYRVFELQCETALANFEKIHQAVGNRVDVVFVNGADFGMQTGPLISRRTYCDLYQPFHKEINNWVHRHTSWKSMHHSCGSVTDLMPDFIEAGFDILNPVQCSAAKMDPRELKRRFGGELTFWGGGVDTQRTLPFGTPAQVRAEVRDRLRAFGPGGGFVFNTIHNVQALTPVENLVALYEAVRDFGSYPVA